MDFAHAVIPSTGHLFHRLVTSIPDDLSFELLKINDLREGPFHIGLSLHSSLLISGIP